MANLQNHLPTKLPLLLWESPSTMCAKPRAPTCHTQNVTFQAFQMVGYLDVKQLSIST